MGEIYFINYIQEERHVWEEVGELLRYEGWKVEKRNSVSCHLSGVKG